MWNVHKFLLTMGFAKLFTICESDQNSLRTIKNKKISFSMGQNDPWMPHQKITHVLHNAQLDLKFWNVQKLLITMGFANLFTACETFENWVRTTQKTEALISMGQNDPWMPHECPMEKHTVSPQPVTEFKHLKHTLYSIYYGDLESIVDVWNFWKLSVWGQK